MRSYSPIFCDECALLAVAILDDRLLCIECLFAALEEGAVVDVSSRVRPLYDNEPKDYGNRAGKQQR